ncbi:MAG: DUF3078 domain-containing protein [candidate division Zixibacteria bacterium]|nr:DUF3078 domain-containing protein [candidate division Zixibacteria bacterium]
MEAILMKKIAIALLGLILLTGAAWAQDDEKTPPEGWQISADLSLNLTQNAYSDNWTGGEAGSVSWTTLANITAENQLSPKFNWLNTGKFGFGQTHTQNTETDEWEKPEKSTDKIDIESVLKMTLGAILDPYAALRIETQFLDNSIPQKKRVLNPILLTESAGGSHTFYKKDKDLIVSRVGLAVRQHIDRVVTDMVNYDETETETTTDAGLEWVSDAKYTISKDRLRYEGKLTVFQAFYNSEKDELEGLPNEDYWKSPDVNWENWIVASITKYIQVTLYTQLLYDKEVDKGGRFKETLSMGVVYKLF